LLPADPAALGIPMLERISFLHVPTMALMMVVLYMALTLILVYSYAFRRTYPGFGAMTLAQVAWTIGVFLNFYRILGETCSLFLGNGLMMLQGVLLYHGLARYGQIATFRFRTRINVALFGLAFGVLCYYLVIDFNTCRRATIFSLYAALIFGRIALEPYISKTWRTYATQNFFCGMLLVVAVLFAIRTVTSWQAVDCPTTAPDNIVRVLLLIAMVCSPLMVFFILAMTSDRVEAELRDARDELRQLAETDSLTGLSNRRHFLRLAGEALARAGEQGEPVSLIMLDLDYFKDINDTHGHQAGDRALCAVARRLEGPLPAACRVGRLGGEEFGVLLPGCDLAAAYAMAGRLRQAMEGLFAGDLAITASFGVAAAGGRDVDGLLAKADECLYAAKRAGRNRIVCQGFPEEGETS
jgi:diguanylate cyclase (GGDEF)-like protein